MNAKMLLENMGWKEGQGLGKANQGISAPIKPKVQLDRNGLGLDPAARLVDPWWAKVYNETAKTLVIENSATVVGKRGSKKTKNKSEEPEASDETLDIGKDQEKPNRKRRKKRNNSSENPESEKSAPGKSQNHEHSTEESNESSSTQKNSHPTRENMTTSLKRKTYESCFVKGNTLQSGDSFKDSSSVVNLPKKKEKSAKDGNGLENPIDSVLLESCDGRTGHKGARYGVLKGKMSRVSQQEKLFLARK